MRLLFILFLMLGSNKCHAESFLGTFGVTLGGGVRMGQGDRANRFDSVYAGMRVSHSEFRFAGANKISLAAPGLNYDTDGVVTVSVAPLMIIIPDSLTISFDYIINKSSKSNAGHLGLFLGFPFGSK